MANLFLKKITFIVFFLIIVFFTFSLFFFKQNQFEFPFSTSKDIQKELFEFEEFFFKDIDNNLETLYLTYSELTVPQEKIKELGSNAFNQIEDFEKENQAFILNNPEIEFRIQVLKLFVYMNVLSDRVNSERILDELPHDENKFSLIDKYIEFFSYTESPAIKEYLKENRDWISKIDVSFYNEAEAKIFLSAPVGKKFPNYFVDFDTLKGEKVDLEKKKGKIILIDFWATWCAPCISELPYLLEANNTYRDQEFEIISISLDENRDNYLKFLREWNIKWVQFYDGKGFTGDLVRKYGIKSLPSTFLLDRNGIVLEQDLQGSKLLRILNRLIK